MSLERVQIQINPLYFLALSLATKFIPFVLEKALLGTCSAKTPTTHCALKVKQKLWCLQATGLPMFHSRQLGTNRLTQQSKISNTHLS